EPVDVDPQYRPDLLVRDVSGFPKLWIECGQVTTTKLDKLASRYPDAAIAVVKRYPREVDNLYERVEKEVRRPWGITYVSFSPDFVDTAANHVSGKNTCVTILSGNEFQLVINDVHYETALYRKSHEAPGYRGKRSP
ncbi:MAG: YaeQ family protein, partial [Planctomycetes bacterium]|nr:YaeQ family protein [Planctomycetota bacterium]